MILQSLDIVRRLTAETLNLPDSTLDLAISVDRLITHEARRHDD